MGALIRKTVNEARTLLTKEYDGEGEPNTIHYHFWCPACRELHFFRKGPGPLHSWSFDGNNECPTFSPSLRYLSGTKCHMHVRQGVIDYCGDCPHDHKGKKVPLPKIPRDTLLYEGIDVQHCGCVNYEQCEWGGGVWRNVSKCAHHKAHSGRGGLAHYAAMGCLDENGKHKPDHYIAEITEPLEAMGVPLLPKEGGRALEIGAGLCMYCPWLRSLGYDYRAIEPDAEAADWSRKNLGAWVYQETFETYAARKEPPPDVILAAHVVEHFYDAPDSLRSFYNQLAPGGRLILVIPDDTDRMNPDHLWFFEPAALKLVLERVGFSDVRTAVRRRVPHENFIYAAAVKEDSACRQPSPAQ